MTFTMLVQEQPSTRTAKPDESTEFVRISEQPQREERKYVSRDKLPICKRSNYSLTPDIIEMARMTEYELMNIKDLTIENENGKIHWLGKTDVVGVNFDELVFIKDFAATVYPAEIEEKGLKPEVGLKINKPAEITLYKLFPPKKYKNSPEAFRETLKNRCETMDDCKFIDYNKNTGELFFRVEHFTKYSFKQSADEEDENDEEEEKDSEIEEPVENYSKSKLMSLQREHDKGRFSFGREEPRVLGKPYTKETLGDIRDNKFREIGEIDDEEEDMDVEAPKGIYLQKTTNFLDDIREESDSQASSFPIDREEEGLISEKIKKPKINFGDILVKEFQEEQPYEALELEEEEEDEEQYEEEGQITVDEIRQKILHNKEKMQTSLDSLNQKRIQARNSARTAVNLRMSMTKGKNNKMLLFKKSDEITATLGAIKMTFTSSVDRVFKNSVSQRRNTEFTVDQKNNMVLKYMSAHYENMLQSQLKASTIKSNEINEGFVKKFGALNLKQKQAKVNVNISAKNQPLPVIEPPSKPYEFSEMFFEILRRSRETLSPNTVEQNPIAQDLLVELKRIINKECQVFALLNACFGNSFIDLSTYMNVPKKLTKSLLEKYREKFDDKEELHRRNLLSNWLKYATVDEIKFQLHSNENLDIYEKASLYLYCGNKAAATSLLTPNQNVQPGNRNSDYLKEFISGNFKYNADLSWK